MSFYELTVIWPLMFVIYYCIRSCPGFSQMNAFLYEHACVCLCKRERERRKRSMYVCDLNSQAENRQTDHTEEVCMISALQSETLRSGTLRIHNREKNVSA